MWAVSVAIDEAPRSEIDTLAFFSAIESLMPSPDEADLAALVLELRDVVGLVGGQHLGEVAVHAQRLGELSGRGLVVARDDRDVLDPALAQAGDDLPDLGPDRRLQLDRAAQPVVHADHHHRVTLAVRLVEGLADFGRQLDPFHLHEPLAADADRSGRRCAR